ncbi:MAG TPA: hypothetical protein OIM49_05525 [Clostridiaceae bacterium]|jgi:hypothetical protein|nr:hypothetical protein [Clostridiaceae bacterium]
MNQTKEKRYKMAYVELNEIIKHLSEDEQLKIPETFKKNLLKEMDKEYKFIFDNKKGLLGQTYMNETKALYIKLYKQYLATEKDVWKKYDSICHSIIENEKRKKYDSNNIFKTHVEDFKSEGQTKAMVKLEEKNIIKKIISKIKKFIWKW